MNKNNSIIHHNYLLFIVYHHLRNIIKTENYFIFINNFKKLDLYLKILIDSYYIKNICFMF